MFLKLPLTNPLHSLIQISCTIAISKDQILVIDKLSNFIENIFIIVKLTVPFVHLSEQVGAF